MKKSRFKTKLSRAQKRNNIIVFTVVFICAYIFVYLFFNNVLDAFVNEKVPEILFFTLISMHFILSLLQFPPLIIAIILGVQKGNAKRVRDDSTFVEVHGFEYYRENLSELNPAIVSLLIDLDIYGKDVIAATLLRLYNKKALHFQEKDGIIITDNNTQGLDNSELELLNLIKSGNLNNKQNLAQWKQNRFVEAEKLGYIQRTVGDKKKAVKYLCAALIFSAASLTLWGIYLSSDAMWDFFLGSSIIGIIVGFLYFLLMGSCMFVPWYLAIRETVYIKRFDSRWERTPLGNEMAEKVAGLAKFINEFSLLSEASKEHVKRWDDYLVYAIVLEENERIIKEISKKYNINLPKLQSGHITLRWIADNIPAYNENPPTIGNANSLQDAWLLRPNKSRVKTLVLKSLYPSFLIILGIIGIIHFALNGDVVDDDFPTFGRAVSIIAMIGGAIWIVVNFKEEKR